ncbi:MAG: metal-dependent hydrolase [Chitinophagaceae bacterium]|nr:MAG: metal-dependent hydrolase [Chitinophagaceae bacterium]
MKGAAIFFAAPFLFAFAANRIHERDRIGFAAFYFFFLIQILLHDLLDTCNAYGTGLLEPFSSQRFSFNTIYVADPIFTIGIFLATLFLFIYRRNRVVQRRVAGTAILISAIYLGISVFNKSIADKYLVHSLQAKNIRARSYFSTPTPFNNLLWYSVAAVDSGFYVGHISVFDDKSRPARFNFFKKDELLLDGIRNQDEVKTLKRFAAEYYTVEKWSDTLVFNVLRFGQMIGWQEPKAHFAFHYYLNPSYSNDLVVQRGRFEGWNRQTLWFMYDRIRGSVASTEEKPEVLPK